jgi:hypothetical protein
MTRVPTRSEVVELLARTANLMGPVARDGPRESPRYLLEIYALYDRCRSMLAAIRLLLEHDFAHEAVIRTRPLITDSLVLSELAALDEDRRVQRVIGWELHSLSSLRRTLDATGEHSAVVAWIDERETQITEYARKLNVGTRHWKPDRQAKELARRHDRLPEYFDIHIAHHFVHGSTLATSQRYSQDSRGNITVGGPAVRRAFWAVAAGCSAAQSALLATRSFCTIVGVPEPEALDLLLADVEQYAHRLQD